jgi:hypothetical protein
MAGAPVVDRRILEALLETQLVLSPAKRLVLVHGSYDPASPERFSVRIGEEPRQVTVTDQPSVLGVVDAWERHRGSEDTGVLVVTTTAPADQLGWDVRAHALGRMALTVSMNEIIRRRFGAAEIDPRILRSAWLVEALLAAEPAGGWRESEATAEWRRSGGKLLGLDAAIRSLVEVRLGRVLDLDSLLTWSRHPAGPERFTALPAEERAGITEWLRRTVGEAAGILLALAVAGRAADAMALGVVAAVLTDEHPPPNAVLAVGGLFGTVATRPEDIKAFSTAVQGTLARWIAEAETDRSERRDGLRRVMDVLDRADALAASADLGSTLGGNPFLPSGLTFRLHALAEALQHSAALADHRLGELVAHRLAGLRPQRVEVARMAVRVRRWLDSDPDLTVPSVSAGVRRHLASWGWLDRALSLLWAGDPESDPVARRAYQALHAEARSRRALLDERFADQVVRWAAHAQSIAPGGCLLIEDVLKEVAVPLAAKAAPLIVVLDGMSSAVAVELGTELAQGGWVECAGGSGGRRAAVAIIPSLTVLSRASLLCGEPTSGGQNVESAGFAAFWKKHRRQGVLFHKGTIAGTAGQRLAQPLMDALAGDAVVGVVLNTIDDALDHGRAEAAWRMSDIAHLPELLNAARAQGRPVMLVSDHGHVLDRSPVDNAPTPGGIGSARWRTGAPGPGEVSVSGPRVLEGGGTVTVPWSETIRYTPRKDGYHGGVSLAELTVPVLTVLPSRGLMPQGWTALSPESVRPGWWNSGPAAAAVVFEDAEDALFKPGIGATVVKSKRYAEQKKYVRRAPEAAQVAAVLDALAAADGNRLSPAHVVAAASGTGRPPRDAELFVTQLERLLNVEGYPVLGLIDAGHTVKLDVELLREQFES